ncbi:MAG: cob(I)yrinic acid a,c-diamide adenosyltransferase [Clostridiaceae bacterium]|nr:cob(I)yrinic acid a,c-diamide adenosyltransferase [Clostridiaceae bacterium]
MRHKGYVHIYCGDGKGKTTAAVGLTIRCVGYGERVLFVQFLKGWDSGELHVLEEHSEVTLVRGDSSDKFVFQMDAAEKRTAQAQYDDNLRYVASEMKNGYHLLVLDEVMAAWNCGLIARALLIDLLEHRPDTMEVVMTGRNPPEELMAFADYISEVRKVRHPYDKGVQARRTIEF